LGNRSYHRSFIILNAQDSGYSLNDRKEPAGYCKLEIKKNQGKLQLYVQDMKPADPQQGIYDVVLVSNQEEVPPAKITSIQIPSNGRGEYEITFDPDNVQEKGAPIEQYHGLAVVYRPLKGERSLQYPLVGYSDKRVVLDWAGQVTDQLERMYQRRISSGFPKARLEERRQPSGLMSVADKKQGRPAETNEAEQETMGEENDVQLMGFKEMEPVSTEWDDTAENEGSGPDSIFNENTAEEYFDEENLVPEEDDVFYKKLEGTYNPDEHSDPALEKVIGEGEINPELLAFEPPDISYIYQDTNAPEVDKAALDSVDSEESDLSSESLECSSENPDASESPDNVPESSASEGSTYSMQFGDGTYWDKVKDYFNRLFHNHKKVTPFDDSAGEVDWIRVENRNEPLYSYYRFNEMNRSSYLDHYLVGLVRNQGKVQYVVYGIPGIYSNVPPMSMHGFSRWLPVKNGYGTGYWLLYIDAISGNIAYPY
jgi:hypothetical protein